MAGRSIRLPRISGQFLRDVPINQGLGSVEELSQEIDSYMDVLMGRTQPPVDNGVLTLMEVADAYYARGMEITYRLQELERSGGTFRGSDFYKFRTGELRTFTEIARRAAELGSRRLTHERLLFDAQRDSSTTVVNGGY